MEILSRKYKIHYNLTRITVTLHENQYSSLIIFRSLLPRMANISDKHCREEQSTYFTLRNILKKIVQFVRKCGKNSVVPLRPKMTIRRMRIVCWKSKALNRLSRNVKYSLFFHIKNGFTNVTQCCVMRTLTNLFIWFALNKHIPFPSTITTASIDISSNIEEPVRLLKMPAGIHLEVLSGLLLEKLYNNTETFRWAL